MLFKFKSQATADMIMLEPDARKVLQIIGKDASPRGIITTDQIPQAIAALQAAVAAEDERAGGQNPGSGPGPRRRRWPGCEGQRRPQAAGGALYRDAAPQRG